MINAHDTMPPQGGQPLNKIDGAKIRLLREKKSLTQLYVATVVGVTTDTISRWENRRYPSVKPENAVKLAEALEVPLEEILDRNGEEREAEPPAMATGAEAPPAPLPFRQPRHFGYALGLFFLLTAITIMSSWWYSARQSIQVTAVRHLPSHAPAGIPFPVAITVIPKAPAAIPLIISETVDEQCSALEGIPPFTAMNSETRTVKWVTKTDRQVTFFYLAMIKPHAPPDAQIPFRGEITLHMDGSTMSPIAGASTIAVAPFHWADKNKDYKIDDGEILSVYDAFGGEERLDLARSQLEEIWSGHGYRWNDTQQRFEVIP